MADQHFILDVTHPHALKVAKLVRDAQALLAMAEGLKFVADEVTAGGTATDSADFQALFGLPNATAGQALYPLFQAIMSGSVVLSNVVEFDQGL